jgi:hypothetical protein
MEQEKVDLSALDPSRDSARWNRLVDSITRRALEARRRRISVPYQLLAWARPAVAMAAAFAVVVLVGASISRLSARSSEVATAKPAVMLSIWAATGNRPSTASMIEVLGGARGSN